MHKAITFIITGFFFILLYSCKTNQYKNGLRSGMWITRDMNDDVVYKSRGRYKKGQEKGTWKYFHDDTLYQKEKYSGSTARVRFYYPNKKIRSSGNTAMEYNGVKLHWYYFGDWKFFDPDGNLLKVVTYNHGNPIVEVKNPDLLPKNQPLKKQ